MPNLDTPDDVVHAFREGIIDKPEARKLLGLEAEQTVRQTIALAEDGRFHVDQRRDGPFPYAVTDSATGAVPTVAQFTYMYDAIEYAAARNKAARSDG